MEKSYDFRCQSLYFCKNPTQPNKNYREELDDQFGTVFYDVMWIWLVEAQWNQEADEEAIVAILIDSKTPRIATVAWFHFASNP